MSLATVIPELRRPNQPEGVRFKIQTNPKTQTGKALVVAYIDARHVGERLNIVCPGEWGTEFEEVQGGVKCALTVCGVTRCDVGWSKGTEKDIDLKARYSDALKRAGVHFGIGAFLYALPQVKVPAKDLDSWQGNNGKTHYAMPEKVLKGLRGSYAQWLRSDAGKVFGDAFDHGDAEDAQGDVDAGEGRTPAEELLPGNDSPTKGGK